MPYVQMSPKYGKQLGLDLLGLAGPAAPVAGEIESAVSVYMRKRQDLARILKQQELEKWVTENNLGSMKNVQEIMKDFWAEVSRGIKR